LRDLDVSRKKRELVVTLYCQALEDQLDFNNDRLSFGLKTVIFLSQNENTKTFKIEVLAFAFFMGVKLSLQYFRMKHQ
jgi:hypothetical protein